MNCKYEDICGGCPLRNLQQSDYEKYKSDNFAKIITFIKQKNIPMNKSIFISDGNRRRAEFTFAVIKGKLLFGFNKRSDHEIADIDYCAALTPMVNNVLSDVKEFIKQLCNIKISKRYKNKIISSVISKGEIWLTQAVNGIDVLLEIEEELNLEHRMLVCDFVNSNSQIVRFCVGKKNQQSEIIAEKSAPYINISDYNIYIGSGTFLQASDAAEKKLIELVCGYIGEKTGNIADLFCGIGTFSYPLSLNKKNKITAIDVSKELLDGLQKSVNKNMIANIKVLQKNLFKYPLTSDELQKFDVVVFDPPRAGASAQISEFLKITGSKPAKVVAISCNPHTFVNDANKLLDCGYEIKEITMVDQFVFSNHFELVALFELKGE